MVDIKIFEETDLTLTAKVRSGASTTNKVKFILSQQGGAAAIEPKEAEVELPASGPAQHTVKLPKCLDDESSYALGYGVEAEGESYMSPDVYEVWPRTLEFKAKGEDGKPLPGVPFTVEYEDVETIPLAEVEAAQGSSQAVKTTQAGNFIHRHSFKRAATVRVLSPWVIKDVDAFAELKGRVREATVMRKPYKAQIALPKVAASAGPDGAAPPDYRQYVNQAHKADSNEGSLVDVKIVTEHGLGALGDEVFVQVVWAETCSKRSKPKRKVIWKPGDETEPDAAHTVKKTFKLTKNAEELRFKIELGLAGLDECTVKAGVTDVCEDASVKIVNWRKLAYEVVQPKPDVVSSYTVFKADKSVGVSDEITAAFSKELALVGIEFAPTRSVFYDAADLGTKKDHRIFPAEYFGLDAGKKVVQMTSADFTGLLNSKATSPAPKKALRTVWADFYAADSTVTVSEPMEAATKEYDVSSPDGVFQFDPIAANGDLGITRLCWWTTHYKDGETWKPVAGAGDPGGAKRAAQDIGLTWAELEPYITIKTWRKLELKLPARADHPEDAGHFLTVDGKPVRIQFYVKFKGAKYVTNASGWHGYVKMSTRCNFKTGGVVGTLLHELGHNLGQGYADKTVDATYGRAAKYEIDGLSFGAGVPDGLLYGGHGHTGVHCADGVGDEDRAKASFKGLGGTCIMFGESSLSKETADSFCVACREHIKATDASDLTKTWETS